ncbi:MAG TPA: transposase [Candidatus Saccharimonadales bacterium]|nr:transposase [Candidatus Saccharimonadales bacterium]
MSPLGIVRDIRTVVRKQLLPEVPKRWAQQIDFGIKAYSLRSFASAGSNARKVVGNVHTASTKADRLLANLKLAGHLGTVFDVLGLVRPTSFVNVDHSDMNGLMALVGAVQTRKGRAIPCLVETTYSDRLPSHADAPPRKKALRRERAAERAQLGLTQHTIHSLKTLAGRLGFWPRFVFDRGFCSKEIIKLLCRHNATFYVRMKADRLVELAGTVTVTKALRGHDNTIQLYGYSLRVACSRRPKGGEPWYILTNDLTSTTKRVLKVYRHRFEIEETFKDMKHIFELKRTRLNKPSSLKVILWLVSIGIALLYLVTKDSMTNERQHNPKKWRSWIRLGYEQLERAYTMMFWGAATDGA